MHSVYVLLQDFALDPEVFGMHTASTHMVRNLTAGMAMITCREPLLLSITSNLRNAFSSVLRVRDMNEVHIHILMLVYSGTSLLGHHQTHILLLVLKR